MPDLFASLAPFLCVHGRGFVVHFHFITRRTHTDPWHSLSDRRTQSSKLRRMHNRLNNANVVDAANQVSSLVIGGRPSPAAVPLA
jgi:hypothetical protein